MIDVNDFVFSLQYGLGIITKINNSKSYDVKYENITMNNVDVNYFNLVNKDVINQIITGNYKDYFSINALERGKEYFLEDKITDLLMMDKNIYAKASGTNNYSLSLFITNDKIRTNCSCPVGKMCKHSAATLFLIENKMNKLLKIANNVDVKNNITKNDSISFNKIIELALTINPNFTQIKDLNRIKDLNSLLLMNIKSNNDLVSFINYLDNYKYETNNYKLTKLLVVDMIGLSDSLKIYSKGIRGINNISLLKELNYCININVNNISNYYPKDARYGIIYSIVNNDYVKFLIFMNPIYNNDYFKKFFIDNYNPNMLPDVMNIDGIDKNKYSSIIKELFKISDIAEKKYIASKIDFPFLSIDEINTDVKDALSFLKLVNDDNDVYRYIVDNYKIARLNDIKALYSIMYKLIMVSRLRKTEKSILENLLYDDNNSRYINKLIHHESFIIDDYNLFFRLFDISYDINIINDSIKVEYMIHLGDILVYTIMYIDDDVSFIHSEFSLDMNDILAKLCKDYLEDNNIDYRNELTKIHEKYNEKKNQEKKMAYLTAINLFDAPEMKLSLLDNNHKVNIDYFIEDSFDDDGKYLLTLKVYIDSRKYIVKDIKDFFQSIRESKNIKYGKELEFNHRIDNFDIKEQKILEFLLMLPEYRSSYQVKYLPLNDKMVETLIDYLKNRYISFNDKEYFVRLDNKKVEISIDDNYILKNDIENGKIIGTDKLYLFNDGYVDKVVGENEYLRLVKFTYDNNNMDISLVKKEFIDKIYSKYYDVVKVNPLIENEFMLSILKIDAYFDYIKGIIKVETKLYKDDVLITSDEFLSDSDKNRLSVYLKYLDRLGFVNYEMLSDNELILKFFRMDFTEFKKVCNVYLSDSILNKKIIRFSAPIIRINYENDIMSAFLEESNYSNDDLYEIMKAIRMKKKFTLLDDNRIIELDEKAIELYDTVSDLKLDIKNLNDVKRINIYDSISAYAHLSNCKLDEYVTKIIEEIKEFKDNKNIEIPNVNAKLREYQKDGYRWLNILSKYKLGGILADDMGLGKTLEIITLIKGDETQKPNLIVCPKSLIFNWYSEINKFDGLTRVIMIYENQNERHKIIDKINNDIKIIYITAYDSLRNDLNYYKEKKFNYIILDEAQAIKNVNAIKSVSVKSLVGDKRFALTGTPIENNVIDLWSIFDFIMPGYLEDLSIFKSRYLSNDTYSNVLSTKIAPFILRRTKGEVLDDLPPKYERIISCDMTDEQRKIYDAHIVDAQQKLKDGSGAFDLLPYLTRLRQICVDPKMFIEDYSGNSGKIEELRNIVNEYKTEHKILIFSSFVKALDRCKEMLIKDDIKYFVLTGDTKLEDRKKMVDEFNNNPSIKVFLISLKAGGTGLNLTGADIVIHLDPWWNLSAENQASDRAHRIGQTKTVEVIKLVSFNSLEERVIELQNIKKDVIDKIISNDDSSITNFSLDDLKYILE